MDKRFPCRSPSSVRLVFFTRLRDAVLRAFRGSRFGLEPTARMRMSTSLRALPALLACCLAAPTAQASDGNARSRQGQPLHAQGCFQGQAGGRRGCRRPRRPCQSRGFRAPVAAALKVALRTPVRELIDDGDQIDEAPARGDVRASMAGNFGYADGGGGEEIGASR